MTSTLRFILRLQIFIGAILFLGGCSVGFDGFKTYNVKDDPNFRETLMLMPQQRIDIIFMVDNSDHMESIQSNMTSNASLIMNELTSRNLDFQLAVGLTDSFSKKYYPTGGFQTTFSQGTGAPSGHPIITPLTPNPALALQTNLTVGVSGSPDTRGLESLEDILDDPINAGIIRSSSHLATVFITNRDDFANSSPDSMLVISSTESCIYNCGSYELYYQPQPGVYVPNITYYSHTPSNPDPGTGRYLIPVSRFRSSVQTILSPTNHLRAYSFHAYSIVDHACRNAMDAALAPHKTIMPHRYMELMTSTGGGVLASACLTASTELRRLMQGIISENYKFKLPEYARHVPFTVTVGPDTIPEDDLNGWSFDPSTLVFKLNGNQIKAADQSINLQFIVD